MTESTQKDKANLQPKRNIQRQVFKKSGITGKGTGKSVIKQGLLFF